MAAEARELHVRLIRFYARLKEQDKKWKKLLKQAENPLESLEEQAEQYRHIRSLRVREIQETIGEEAWQRLQYKIRKCMENEIVLLVDILAQLKNISQDIKNHWKNLESARDNVNVQAETMQELVKGTPSRPNLTNLLMWAKDTHQHYEKMCSRMDNGLDKLNYNVGDTIEDLAVTFMDDKSGRNYINEVLFFTGYLADEPFPPAIKNTDPTSQQKNKN